MHDMILRDRNERDTVNQLECEHAFLFQPDPEHQVIATYVLRFEHRSPRSEASPSGADPARSDRVISSEQVHVLRVYSTSLYSDTVPS
ncbi:unnamed protein product [Echinostoma caproni]|uniref:Uncharacterized protein n=1 Tax=Echinostoma caproni TaxID=27848 RepID=A0A3P8HL04_9TREM|nr:unnamed protein product [Echinostoma caproni]